jgi:hypothetical protein
MNTSKSLTCEMIFNLSKPPFAFFETNVPPPHASSTWLDHWLYRAQSGHPLTILPVPSDMIVPEEQANYFNLDK